MKYRVDTSSDRYLYNWYLSIDLKCNTDDEIASIPASYFFGYGCGLMLFFLPDKFGRKMTMNMVLPLYIISSHITVYGKTINAKKLGFFLQGYLHIKYTNLYTHAMELVPEKYKHITCTAITGLDAGPMLYNCFVIYFIKRDVHTFLEFSHKVSAVATIIYLLIAPESPRWHFLNKGNKSKEAINTLNYISWFNGSNNRVPEIAIFDQIGQLIDENETKINNTNMTRSRINASTIKDVLAIDDSN